MIGGEPYTLGLFDTAGWLDVDCFLLTFSRIIIETYLRPSQTSIMELFWQKWLTFRKYSLKKLHYRWLTGSLIGFEFYLPLFPFNSVFFAATGTLA